MVKLIKKPSFDKLQKRVANISIGNTTLRGQPVGTKDAAINFLKKMNLDDFSNINEDIFKNKLNEYTVKLAKELPLIEESKEGKIIHIKKHKNWGAARKALNIFLFQASQDIHLSEEYKLRKIIPYLEVPLDGPNGKRLVKKVNGENKNKKLKWPNIKNLKKDESDKIQKIAKKVATEEYKCERCYLDVFWWRENKKGD